MIRFPAPLFALGLAAMALPATVRAEEVRVFAAASMKTALDRFAARWEAQTGHKVSLTYAGSNLLAKQIIEGAPADIFISAAENWMDEVEKAGELLPETRIDLFGNTLVLIAHGKAAAPLKIGEGFDLPALLQGEYLAMALVDSVPAGQYGKAALTNLGLWEQVAPQVAQMDNVRAALALVASGEAPYGIVYATDASAADNVSVVATFPAQSYPPIRYPAALLTGAQDAADRAFFDALSGAEADTIFAAEGFSVFSPSQ